MNRPASRGFTLLELLVVLAIIVILAAIAIPTLLNALDRGRQKATMAELRTIGGAIEAYSVDQGIYPDAANVIELANVLEPAYIGKIALKDAWKHDFLYEGDPENYTVGSAGKEGGIALALTGGGGETQDFTDDIIYFNGSFIQWPAGTQK